MLSSKQKHGRKKEDTTANAIKENLMIFLLINGGQDVYKRVKDEITPEDFKNDDNRKIVQILYEELEKGDITNVIGLFENNDQLLSHVTYILSKETDISDIDKAIEDIEGKFLREKLQDEKTKILKKLVSSDTSEDEAKELGNRLKDISKKLSILK